ncbi:hypothetical protein Aph01nite_38780 [Acrocarpospora phusangensis]|uniref:Ricin B lectin domain-containing protein n=1 Tax=Acrocarpospora phusangensis TaxID=1070424 RepID=A0A919QBE4_9ACTN|nr:RICIN domain-containing protein [Acrocarpospora phusangensis]GIH25568.1 hypothetical protein Aph01nite_38780 [Acrocarpospora phusangensis]
MSHFLRVPGLVAGAAVMALPLSLAGSAWAGERPVEIRLAAKPESSVVNATAGGRLTIALADTIRSRFVSAMGSSLRFTAPPNLTFTGVADGMFTGGWTWSQWYRCALDSDTQITCARDSGYYGLPVRDETISIPVAVRNGTSPGTYTGGLAEFTPGKFLPDHAKVSIPFAYSVTGEPSPPTAVPSEPAKPPAEPAVEIPRPKPGKPGYLRLSGDEQMAIEVKDGDSANNTPVVLRVYDGGAAQQWEINPIRNDSIMLRNPQTRKCLDIGAKKPDVRTPVNIWRCSLVDYPEQEWKLRHHDDEFEIYSPYADKCLEQSSGADGVQLMVASCDKSAAQRWKWNS